MIRLLPLTLLLCAAFAAPAAAHTPIVGIGDQHAEMFSDPAFRPLGIKHSRYLIAWDWFRKRSTVAQTDFWVRNARNAGVDQLLGKRRDRSRLSALLRERQDFDDTRTRCWVWIKWLCDPSRLTGYDLLGEFNDVAIAPHARAED